MFNYEYVEFYIRECRTIETRTGRPAIRTELIDIRNGDRLFQFIALGLEYETPFIRKICEILGIDRNDYTQGWITGCNKFVRAKVVQEDYSGRKYFTLDVR